MLPLLLRLPLLALFVLLALLAILRERLKEERRLPMISVLGVGWWGGVGGRDRWELVCVRWVGI